MEESKAKKDLEELIKTGIATSTALAAGVMSYWVVKFDEYAQPGMENSPLSYIAKAGLIGLTGLMIWGNIKEIKDIERNETIDGYVKKDNVRKGLFGLSSLIGAYSLYTGNIDGFAVSAMFSGGMAAELVTNKLKSIHCNEYGSKRANLSESFEKILETPASQI